MKALIIRNAFTHDFGGAERLPVHMASYFESQNITPVIVSRQQRLLEYAASEGVKQLHRGWWWSKQNWSGAHALLFPVYLGWELILSLWYMGLLLRVRPDVVHILSKDDFIAATLAAKLLGKPVFWTDCADLKFLYQNHTVWYKNPVGKLVYVMGKLANAVTIMSNNEMALIEESLHRPAPSNYTVIHLGARAQSTNKIDRKPEDKDAVIFCATSRLVIAKGIGELIEAFNMLSSNSTRYRLWLIGDGPDEAQFKQSAAGNQYITFFGHQDKPLAYVAAADVFVHPTHHEAFSLSLSEAAMLGKPLIATRVGGNPEIVSENNGILVPVKGTTALREAMQRLGEDASLRTSMGKQARDDYFEKFEFNQALRNRIITLYEAAKN
jgi:glycosyltransferase involved in cell wall biosynthesis